MYFSLKSQWWYFHTFSDTPTLFTHLTHSGLLILCWEIGKILSKITKNVILPNFNTISNILQSVVITQEKIIQIWNQLIKTVILIPINPIKSTKKNSWEGSPLWICKFNNLRAASTRRSRTSSNELKFFLVVPRVISHGKSHIVFLSKCKMTHPNL